MVYLERMVPVHKVLTPKKSDLEPYVPPVYKPAPQPTISDKSSKPAASTVKIPPPCELKEFSS